jgi:hypothetical protein
MDYHMMHTSCACGTRPTEVGRASLRVTNPLGLCVSIFAVNHDALGLIAVTVYIDAESQDQRRDWNRNSFEANAQVDARGSDRCANIFLVEDGT